jgi:hypothetical protein
MQWAIIIFVQSPETCYDTLLGEQVASWLPVLLILTGSSSVPISHTVFVTASSL